MKQNHTKHVYFSFFNPLKVTGELEIESLGWVHGGDLGGGELTMGQNRYHSSSVFCQTVLWVQPYLSIHNALKEWKKKKSLHLLSSGTNWKYRVINQSNRNFNIPPPHGYTPGIWHLLLPGREFEEHNLPGREKGGEFDRWHWLIHATSRTDSTRVKNHGRDGRGKLWWV